MVNKLALAVFFISLFPGYAIAEGAAPDIEFLEYLAEMESDRGQWVDPIKVNELASNEHIDSNDDTNNVEQGDDE